ncbi:MAG TPA: type IX secretion system outer membrane channel protein PorV [Ignavibacteria bacterium]|nr:type IX secretion system outer membrane channel protein PorV [Ignavibacteria bacterium]HRE09489.1 type IX secretion system outer membrane channel protein PorV [Ignavibacteria bacterium]HRF64613.1 type IX secretion system outer membrane channel protein PorV [Ignavibacteria bacterium]HRJ05030.1 type IX secretion system outer membrane channel protein PorV [Ignavibacteria bacterium]HRJ85304.1 type IX secretion system outer membrane channel protein PorV [Ignavibacteria bacterium]
MFKIKMCMLAVLVALSGRVFAQGESAVPFLLIGPNSLNSGMGETGTGMINDASAMFWNPAGLGFQKGAQVSITHSPWLPGLGLSDLFYDFLAGKYYLKKLKGTLGVSITYLNIGKIIQTDEFGNEIGNYQAFDGALAVGYGTKVSRDLGVGVVTRFIYSKLAVDPVAGEQGTGTAYDLSFDLSMLWRPSKTKMKFLNNKFGLGVNLSNIGPKVTYVDNDQADPLPTNLRLGFAYDIYQSEYNNLTLTADFAKLLVKRRENGESDPVYKGIFTSFGGGLDNVMKSIQSSVGAEYWYGNPKLIGLRGGFFYEDPDRGKRKFITLGASIRYSMYGFDFSYINTIEENHPLANTLRFTLSVNFGQPETTVKKPEEKKIEEQPQK